MGELIEVNFLIRVFFVVGRYMMWSRWVDDDVGDSISFFVYQINSNFDW